MAYAPSVPDEIAALTEPEVVSILVMNSGQFEEEKDRQFAEDLCRKGAEKGWSLSQNTWAKFLVAKLTGHVKGHATKIAIPPGGFGAVFAMIMTAKTNGLKWPAIWLKLPTEGDLKIALAGPNSSYAGKLLLTDGKPFAHNRWYGSIDAAGNWKAPGMLNSKIKEEIADTLAGFATDPAGTATGYGKLTGSCCFCAKTLTDPKSTAAGFGPVCATKFGLMDQWSKAAGVGDPTLTPAQGAE